MIRKPSNVFKFWQSVNYDCLVIFLRVMQIPLSQIKCDIVLMKKIALTLIMAAGIGMVSCKSNKTDENSGTAVDTAATVTDSVPASGESVAPTSDSVAPTTDTVPK